MLVCQFFGSFSCPSILGQKGSQRFLSPDSPVVVQKSVQLRLPLEGAEEDGGLMAGGAGWGRISGFRNYLVRPGTHTKEGPGSRY